MTAVKLGPFGVYGLNPSSNFCMMPGGKIWDEIGNKDICQILIHHGTGIDSIQIAYFDGTSVQLSETHGGDANSSHLRGGNRKSFDLVTIDYPDEYLTSLTVTQSAHYVTSLTFGTNQRTYGPFGTKSASRYCFEMGKDFFGFHGYSGYMGLTAIGVYINPSARLKSLSSRPNTEVQENEEA